MKIHEVASLPAIQQAVFDETKYQFCDKHTGHKSMRRQSTAVDCSSCDRSFESFWAHRAFCCADCSVKFQRCSICGIPISSLQLSQDFITRIGHQLEAELTQSIISRRQESTVIAPHYHREGAKTGAQKKTESPHSNSVKSPASIT
jgi:protein-arginine kinase activator protein McsA